MSDEDDVLVKPKHPIARAIWDDLHDRRGLRQEMEGIDDDIQQEIADKWDKLCEEDAQR